MLMRRLTLPRNDPSTSGVHKLVYSFTGPSFYCAASFSMSGNFHVLSNSGYSGCASGVGGRSKFSLSPCLPHLTARSPDAVIFPNSLGSVSMSPLDVVPGFNRIKLPPASRLAIRQP